MKQCQEDLSWKKTWNTMNRVCIHLELCGWQISYVITYTDNRSQEMKRRPGSLDLGSDDALWAVRMNPPSSFTGQQTGSTPSFQCRRPPVGTLLPVKAIQLVESISHVSRTRPSASRTEQPTSSNRTEPTIHPPIQSVHCVTLWRARAGTWPWHQGYGVNVARLSHSPTLDEEKLEDEVCCAALQAVLLFFEQGGNLGRSSVTRQH